ncbi:MAG: hypothetical protein JXR78_00060 [Victivallales bacterium]|nr:hypothetical protein [Victivallales bacterium]
MRKHEQQTGELEKRSNAFGGNNFTRLNFHIKHGVISILIVLAFLTFAADTAKLKLDGTLGQSQNANNPADFLSLNGVAMDHDGHIWTSRDNIIYRLVPNEDGKYEIIQRFPNPYHIYAPENSTLVSGGRKIYFRGTDDTIYELVPSESKLDFRAAFKLPDRKSRRWTITPENMSGMGGMGRFFYLDDQRQLIAVAADGSPVGSIFRYPPPPTGTKWQYDVFGFEPESGDLLVASTYPDYRIYRFDSRGEMIRNQSWPRPEICFRLVTLERQVWSLFNRAAELPPVLSATTPATRITSPHSTSYPTGLVRLSSGQLLLADGHGLTRYSSDGKTALARIGGFPDCSILTVGSDGTVLAAVQRGELLVSLLLDDLSDAPFNCGSNEPWRIGGQWQHRASGMVPLGKGTYIVLDQTAGQLWQYTPALERELRKAWVPLTSAETFRKTQALAANERHFYVLADNRLFTGAIGHYDQIKELTIPMTGVKYLAASDNGGLLTATDTEIAFYRIDAREQPQPEWRQPGWGNIVGIAADADKIAVSDRKNLAVGILSLANGEKIARLDYRQIPGRFSPGPVAIHGNYLVLADNSGKRLLRLLFTP